jgi:predicted secreted hydrolase
MSARARLACFLCLACLLVSGCSRTVEALAPAPASAPTPVPPVTFPRDALPHDVLTEWWYYTGHLSTPDGRPYGFEFTIFQIRRQDVPTAYIAHFAISDINGQRFMHQARFVQGEPQPMPIDVQGWRLSLGDTITASMDNGSSLSLQLTDEKPPALHHGGYIDEGPSVGGSYYYSRTRLSASGTLSGTPVTGQAWMDHQWGNFIVPSSASGGWDWYSLQLDDNSEVMLYVLRGPTDSPVFGSLIAPDGQVSEIQATAEPVDHWTSPHTGAEYPSGWRITFPDHQLILTPQLQDQELYFPEAPAGSVPSYWEGAVTIGGTHTGQGYVELTGYAPQR